MLRTIYGSRTIGLPLWCRFENVFPPEAHAALFSSLAARETEFVKSRTATSTFGHRRSVILWNVPEITSEFEKLIRQFLPIVIVALGCESFTPTSIVSQITAHNDGDYYKIHSDSGNPTAQHRKITFVYYFHPEPHAFGGGELVLYGYAACHKTSKSSPHIKIFPQGNTMVFFRSDVKHEVLPVSCPSSRFEDGRFTINGWVS
jgi:Rps23 Pro-64 3,4-dihydroxylase Tpa1-like proline 4-hydroxylase